MIPTRMFGRTGLLASRLGLGLAALGRPGYINLGHATDLQGDYDIPAMEARAHAVFDAARQAGVRYFDAARSYGRAEAFLASWLSAQQVTPGEVIVGSKWGYTYTANWKIDAAKHEVKDHTLTTLARQFGESRSLLGDHLRVYQIHSATLESGVLDNREVLTELARLKADGMKIGLTLSGPHQADTLRRAMTITAAGNESLFDCVQATWNLLEPSVGPALEEAHQAGMGVIVKESLANGRLTSRNNDPAFAPRQLLEKTAAQLKTTVDALALAAVLAQDWADVVLSGAATVEQLSSNFAATQIPWEDAISAELRSVAEEPSQYWSTRGGLAWN